MIALTATWHNVDPSALLLEYQMFGTSFLLGYIRRRKPMVDQVHMQPDIKVQESTSHLSRRHDLVLPGSSMKKVNISRGGYVSLIRIRKKRHTYVLRLITNH